ncbi:conserved phage C-terminal domain-containing protein [Schnuerera sp.]|uniref:conserved phage C-terminal domain-containing protein n=1 Tax=Schnuerera sp. TaxID=2794844 RepID=UPI002C192DB0|nr:conserved phage C-terminal domain-containing protein [Schnuerera sp.]HSH36025.1 conserved phage C-terminal domain-containing protein [Schnuerera sp.]
MAGWIKLHRKLLYNPVFDNPNLLRVWLWCLLKASHDNYQQMVGLQVVDLEPGQFVTGRFKGSDELEINPSTFYKYLKTLEKMQMISLNSNNKMTVVTIENWRKYQTEDKEAYQQNNNKITTKEQQNNTNKNYKNDKNDKKVYKDIVEYLNKKTNKNFRHTTKATQRLIGARLNEGFTLDDFKKVIDIKSSQWLGGKMEQYLRPQTLFGTKFESYLNEGGNVNGKHRENNRQDDDQYEGIGLSFEDLQEL